DYECIASGEQATSSPILIPAQESLPAVKVFMFTAPKPLRYLAFVVSRLSPVSPSTVQLDASRGFGVKTDGRSAGAKESVELTVQAGRQVLSRGNQIAGDLVDIEQFYHSILGETPYETLTLAALESTMPGGHSPAYFALLNEPLPGLPVTWRNDP